MPSVDKSDSKPPEAYDSERPLDTFDFSDPLFRSRFSYDEHPTMILDTGTGEGELSGGQSLDEYHAEGRHLTEVAEKVAKWEGADLALSICRALQNREPYKDGVYIPEFYKAAQYVHSRLGEGKDIEELETELIEVKDALRGSLRGQEVEAGNFGAVDFSEE